MFKLFYRFRHPNRIDDSDEATRRIEGALESSTRRIQAIDPETDGQWRRLKSTLESRRSLGYNHLADSSSIIFRPAFSFAVASIILIVIGGVVLLRTSSTRIYETAKGQHSTITLQDSTEVTLNYMSELKVNRSPFEKARHVALKGEAIFQVRRDGTPFIITTEIGTIQVLGTQFNVRVREDKMEVAVLSGSVKVSVSKNGTDSSIILTKGQIVVCDKNNYPEVPGSLPFSDYPGWTSGKFMFYRTNLLSACKEMELQFDVPIRIKTPQHDNVTITGIVNGQNIDAALTTLTQLTGNTYRYEDGGYVIF
jgi:ferric-dicitrate binding protein FerR (iron transport regulator)